MPAENLHELFVDELKDIYDAEKQLTKALPKMAKAADQPGPARGVRGTPGHYAYAREPA